MKILFLQEDFPPESFGGAGIVVFNLAREMSKLGHQVFVITIVREKSQEGKIRYQDMEIYRICSCYNEKWRAYLSLYNPFVVRKVAKTIAEIQPDVVHAHNLHYHLSYYCLKIAKKSGAKVFFTAHDVMLFHYGKMFEFIDKNNLEIPKIFNYKISAWQQFKRFRKRYNPLRNIIIKHYLKYADKIFAVSGALKEALRQNGINNVEVIHNGISMEDWVVSDAEIKDFKNKYNFNGKKVVFFGGRLSALKGGEEILAIMEQVSNKIPEAVLLVAGRENKYAQRMTQEARRRNIQLIITGWLYEKEIKAAYNCSDVVVVPSICFDTFNLFNIESMAVRKPVVGTCFGGTPEIIVNNETGFVVNPLNIQDCADKIACLLKDENLAKQMGEKGYIRVKKLFSIERQYQKTLAWYNSFSNTKAC